MSQEERIARARAALARAELRTGARSMAPSADGGHPGSRAGRAAHVARDVTSRVQGALALADVSMATVLPGTSVAPAQVEQAQADQVSRTSTAGPPSPAERPTPGRPGVVADLLGRAPASPASPRGPARGPVLLTDRPPLAVPPALAPLLPDGLRRGSTTAVLGSTSLVLAMIAAACTAREAWAAVVGQPSLGLLAAAQTGVALGRLAVVPKPGVDTPTVVAALLDGIDVVVVGPGARLVDADRRRLMARARDRGSVLLSTAPWPGAGCVLTVEGGRWTGVGDGDGRLRAHELHVTRTGRGRAGRTQDLRVVLPLEVGTDPYGLPTTAAAPAAGDADPVAPLRAPAAEAVPGVPGAPGLRLVG